jgi:mono/diheme cytochrome c family protein
MKKKNAIRLAVVAVVVLGLLYWVFHLPSVDNPAIATDAASIARGAYLYNAAGCGSCHQEEGAAGPTGGHALESPFGGSFLTPNITPDEATGIGGWTGRDFLLALKHGRSPGGGFYWPAFPYRSYRNMTDQDVLDVAAYLMSLPAIRNDVPDHDLPGWQFSGMMAGWNIMANLLEGTPPAAAVATRKTAPRGLVGDMSSSHHSAAASSHRTSRPMRPPASAAGPAATSCSRSSTGAVRGAGSTGRHSRIVPTAT